jgi:hypothetical protein
MRVIALRVGRRRGEDDGGEHCESGAGQGLFQADVHRKTSNNKET